MDTFDRQIGTFGVCIAFQSPEAQLTSGHFEKGEENCLRVIYYDVSLRILSDLAVSARHTPLCPGLGQGNEHAYGAGAPS